MSSSSYGACCPASAWPLPRLHVLCTLSHSPPSLLTTLPRALAASPSPLPKCQTLHHSNQHPLHLQFCRDQPHKPLNIPTLSSLLLRCAEAKNLADGKRLHVLVSSHGYDRITYVSNCLVLMYGSCGSMPDARAAFDKIEVPNSYSWSILMKVYAQNGSLDEARDVFSKMPQRDLVSWNTMISACAQNRRGEEALNLFRQMQVERVEPNKVTFLCTIEACASLANLEESHDLFTVIRQSRYKEDIVVVTALLNMYGKCGRPGDALHLFNTISQHDAVSWNAMIAAYSQNGYGKEALDLFNQMLHDGMKPTEATFVCALDACANLSALREGHRIHAVCVDNGYSGHLVVGNALINMYGKCGSLLDARYIFGKLHRHNVVSWTAMMTAYVQENQGKEALDAFRQMQLYEIKPNKVTFVCALDACASLAALEEGLAIHAAIADSAFELDILVGTALIHMYGKCGRLQDARTAFGKMPEHDLACWNAMLTACSQNGYGDETLHFFDQMQFEGVKPNCISFICILTACNHMGWVDDARHYFMSINRDHGLPLIIEHYVCMIDLLGRAGCLDEAEDLISSIRSENIASAWLNLLAACRIHGDVERALRAAYYYTVLNPAIATPYVMLSNIYASAGS